jgi:recombinational DNA repair ATPase RecF
MNIADVVLDLAESDPELSEQAKMFILAALDSEESLAGALSTEPDTKSPPPVVEPVDQAEREPVGAFLTSIEVAGFRGIGPRAKLRLHPGPGLTVVAGRNGSGKSSFAEALELALTGESYRWRAEKAAVWTGAWRNIHQGTPCEIRIGLAEEGSGSTAVGLNWDKAAELGDRKVWVQRAGGKQETGLATLGWGSALDLYRPILSSDELSTLLEAKSSQLFDELEKLLGLQQVKDAQARLAAALKRLQEPEVEARAVKVPLKQALEGSEDERAAAALNQLRKHKPDLDAVARLATGTSAQPAGEVTLRALANISLPTLDVVADAVDELRRAIRTMAEQGDQSIALAERRTDLLAQAVNLHAQHGDMTCPVCGEGSLDSGWHDRVTAELAQDNADLAKFRSARNVLRHRLAKSRDLVNATVSFSAPEGIGLHSLLPAQAAQARWNAAPADDSGLADHIVRTYPELAAATAAVRIEAAELLTAHEDAWTPIAQQLATWAELKQRAQSQSDVTTTVHAAANWVKENIATLRNQRMEPLAKGARAIWAKLRQESNVELGAISLEGQNTRRRVELLADVDGEETQALSVMSRGELHALALALFLPRATMQASALRFVVLDDPVQAMDPAKVDGFAHVLVEIAQDRQVVVFSHDDRLADAVRRIDPHARIVEVTRAGNSEVQITDSRTPAYRYIEDARALASDKALDPGVKAKVLPGLCRFALEAATYDVFVRARYLAGHDRASTEDTWSSAKKTIKKLALALHDDADKDVSPWRDASTWRKATLDTCARGVHAGLGSNPHGAVNDLEKTVADVLGRQR